MSEGAGGEKTEQATPKRRQDAREKGNVLKSQEVTVSASLMIMFVALQAFIGTMGTQMQEMMIGYLSGKHMTGGGIITIGQLTDILLTGITYFFIALAPLLVVAMLAAVITNVMQFGLMFSTKALKPKFDKLNPIDGFKRMFSSRTLFDLVKSVIKVVLIVWIVWGEYEKLMMDFPLMMVSEVPAAIVKISSVVFSVAIKLCVALLAFSVADFAYQYWKYEKELKMTKYEIKMEYKQQEGDPQIKSKIKQKQRQMAMMRMMQSVPDADIVITNPTHFAVALQYDRNGDSAPIVVAKGQDKIALRIKEIARESNVEIVENKPLARSLFEFCEVGMEIPVELYSAVADVLAYVYTIKNKLGVRK